MSGYYYLHQNGELIYKPHGDVADFRESDFVVQFWPIDVESRLSAWSLLVEALSLGAKEGRVSELAAKWSCDDEDAEVFAKHIGLVLEMDGNQFCAKLNNFINVSESQVGFGDSALEALANLCKDLGYKAQKMWGASFVDLVKAFD